MKIVRRATTSLLLVGLLSLVSGCMTFDHLFDPDQKLEMYGGTKSSWAYVSDERAPFFGAVIRLIDLPVTAIMDTLILPVVAPSVGK